ncbi:unnamed protein product [Cuscuta campestris]|uniref:Small acidic protein 1 n=1 Tax=Cuscuta campestris TaxID=132261 RepID=A0A484KJE3_9ASTE|nr:unnamed protein product [Cuscuta campestris]
MLFWRGKRHLEAPQTVKGDEASGDRFPEFRVLKMKHFELADMDELGSTVAMDVDEVEALDIFSDGPLGGTADHHRLADADFFNSFEDDFDDLDIN